jgi:G3E family GTPase
VAIIVNEVGQIGIDGTLLKSQDVDIMELTSGCICCTIKTDFFKAVQEIHKTFNPSHLIVEATGIAQPGDMFDILFEPPVSEFSRLSKLITVVDTDFFKAKDVLGSFYDNQIQCADLLILNKIDLVEADELERIEVILRDLNPGAKILSAQYCQVDPALLFGADSTEPHRISQGHHSHHHGQEGFHSFSFEDERPINRNKLDKLLDSLPPNLFRCKGWVRFKNSTGLLNFTGGNYRIEPSDESRRHTALVFVGRNCNEKEILRALEDCLETVS